MYMLRVNDNSLFFRKLSDVKMWFNDCGLTGVLVDDEEQTYSLDELENIVGVNLNIVNLCMCERGDDYCTIELQVITFEY